MNFDIEEDFEEKNAKQNKGTSVTAIVVITIVSILLGLIVFFISNATFGNKNSSKNQPTNSEVELSDENVQILYNYVTYGVRNTRNDKFIKTHNVSLSSFTNQEKFYYALQFAQVEDFVATGEVNDQNQKVYAISGAKIKTYMQRYFGNKVTYATNSVITYPFSFRINSQNVGVMTYSIEKDAFLTVFTGLEENIVDESIVKPYYTKLVKATRNGIDGSLTLDEKIIYTDSSEENGIYTVHIYKDYEHKNLIETKQNITKEELLEQPILVDRYEEKATTIHYVFKLNNMNYYFDSSRMTN